MTIAPDAPHAARSAARLAVVQGLYQMEQSGASTADVIDDFRAGRLPRQGEEPCASNADFELFRGLIEEVVARQDKIDQAIARRLAAGWRLERIDAVARAILRAGAVELAQFNDAPSAVIINEYVEIAHAFFDGPEPGFINAALDACAQDLRAPAP